MDNSYYENQWLVQIRWDKYLSTTRFVEAKTKDEAVDTCIAATELARNTKIDRTTLNVEFCEKPVKVYTDVKLLQFEVSLEIGSSGQQLDINRVRIYAESKYPVGCYHDIGHHGMYNLRRIDPNNCVIFSPLSTDQYKEHVHNHWCCLSSPPEKLLPYTVLSSELLTSLLPRTELTMCGAIPADINSKRPKQVEAIEEYVKRSLIDYIDTRIDNLRGLQLNIRSQINE